MFNITEKALLKIKQQLKENQYFRVGVKSGGCSGFSYVLQIEENSKFKDNILDFDGIKILIDPKSQILLKDTILDYDNLNLISHGFKFINSQEDKKCGCGASFSIK